MTVQRSIAVLWPHKVSTWLSIKRAGYLLLTIVSISALFSVPSFFNLALMHHPADPSIQFCNYVPVQEQPYFFSPKFINNMYLNVVLFDILTVVIMIVANVVMINHLRAESDLGNLTAGSIKINPGDNAVAKQTKTSMQTAQRRRKVNSITLTVVSVTSAFIVLTIPNLAIAFVDFPFVTSKTTQEEFWDIENMYALLDIFNMWALMNNSINFYLYALTGRRFRKEFFNLLSLMMGLVRCKSNE